MTETDGELCVDCESVDPLQVRRQTFSVGRAFGGGLRLFRAEPVTFLVAIAITGVLSFAWDSVLDALQSGGSFKAGYWASTIFSATVGLLAQLFVMHYAVERAEGKTSSASDSWRFARNYYGEAFGVRWRSGWTIALFALLLIVPGIIKAVQLALVLPCVVKRDAARPLDRSKELVAGHGWGVFAVGGLSLLVFFTSTAVVAGILGFFGALLKVQTKVEIAFTTSMLSEAYSLLQSLVLLSAYYALRHEEEVANAIDVPPSASGTGQDQVIAAIPA